MDNFVEQALSGFPGRLGPRFQSNGRYRITCAGSFGTGADWRPVSGHCGTDLERSAGQGLRMPMWMEAAEFGSQDGWEIVEIMVAGWARSMSKASH